MRTEHGITSDFKTKKGVRQSCVFSPSLSNLYTERIFREVEDMRGVSIGGVNVNNLKYANDTSLMAESISNLQDLVTTVHEKRKPYGVEINISKTKAMVVSRKDPVPVSISIEGKQIQQVSSLEYLGYMVFEDGRCEAEIKRRIAIARSSFENMSRVLASRHININLRQRILRCYIWSALRYGTET